MLGMEAGMKKSNQIKNNFALRDPDLSEVVVRVKAVCFLSFLF